MIARTNPPPCAPVAPTIAMIFFNDIKILQVKAVQLLRDTSVSRGAIRVNHFEDESIAAALSGGEIVHVSVVGF
jgi:hypothetical protein